VSVQVGGSRLNRLDRPTMHWMRGEGLDRQGEGVSCVVGSMIYDCDGCIDDRGIGLGGEIKY
jgi:hypothetical protein